MRRRLFEYCELICFLAAWAVGILSVWTDSQADPSMTVTRQAAAFDAGEQASSSAPLRAFE